jgi:hypothetical protein
MKYLLLLAMLFAFSGCEEVKIVGDIFCKIYPKDGYADCAKVVKQEPVEVTDPVEVTLEELSGYIAVPEAQFAKYRRAYEKENSKIIQPLDLVERKLTMKREADAGLD